MAVIQRGHEGLLDMKRIARIFQFEQSRALAAAVIGLMKDEHELAVKSFEDQSRTTARLQTIILERITFRFATGTAFGSIVVETTRRKSY